MNLIQIALGLVVIFFLVNFFAIEIVSFILNRKKKITHLYIVNSPPSTPPGKIFHILIIFQHILKYEQIYYSRDIQAIDMIHNNRLFDIVTYFTKNIEDNYKSLNLFNEQFYSTVLAECIYFSKERAIYTFLTKKCAQNEMIDYDRVLFFELISNIIYRGLKSSVTDNLYGKLNEIDLSYNLDPISTKKSQLYKGYSIDIKILNDLIIFLTRKLRGGTELVFIYQYNLNNEIIKQLNIVGLNFQKILHHLVLFLKIEYGTLLYLKLQLSKKENKMSFNIEFLYDYIELIHLAAHLFNLEVIDIFFKKEVQDGFHQISLILSEGLTHFWLLMRGEIFFENYVQTIKHLENKLSIIEEEFINYQVSYKKPELFKDIYIHCGCAYSISKIMKESLIIRIYRI